MCENIPICCLCENENEFKSIYKKSVGNTYVYICNICLPYYFILSSLEEINKLIKQIYNILNNNIT